MDDNPEDTGNSNKALTLWALVLKTKRYAKTDFYRRP